MIVWYNCNFVSVCLTGSCSSRKGLNGACSVHEYTGSFVGQNVRYKMTSVCGHVMSLDFTGKPFYLLTVKNKMFFNPFLQKFRRFVKFTDPFSF